jgi:hypothetical protein
MKWQNLFCILSCFWLLWPLYQSSKHTSLNIVFVYTVVKSSCKDGLPTYVRYALEQSIFSQPDCHTVLLSNIQDCPSIADSVKDIEGLHLVDSFPIVSNRTLKFENLSNNVFLDMRNSLWMTSALRFFLLEDFMKDRGWKELIHFEADNMLYGRLTTMLPSLRQYYPLAVTPLNTQLTFLTASVFWISNLKSLIQFNDFLADLVTNHNNSHDRYIDYLRPAFAKRNGAYPNKGGIGVKPFSINEMSMLAYYHFLYPKELVLLSVVPSLNYPADPNFPQNFSDFSPQGSKVGPAISHAIWDSGSYGQFVGGTKEKKGRNKRFTDGSHIIGGAIRQSVCGLIFWCSSITENDYSYQHYRGQASSHPSSVNSFLKVSKTVVETDRCYTAPFVRCGGEKHWTPLWNLHVHSKHTIDYKSSLCDCEREGGKGNNITFFVNNTDFYWKPIHSPL